MLKASRELKTHEPP